MKDDMPWVLGLTPEEIRELRSKKQSLTQYGRGKLRELMEKQERCWRSERILQRYNDFYNLECSGLTHGTPITPEHLQAIALDSMIAAIRCEYLNQEYTSIEITDIEDLIEALYRQSTAFLERTKSILRE